MLRSRSGGRRAISRSHHAKRYQQAHAVEPPPFSPASASQHDRPLGTAGRPTAPGEHRSQRAAKYKNPQESALLLLYR